MDKEQIAQEIKQCENKLAELRKKMQEPERPVIRHGDYGYFKPDEPFLFHREDACDNNSIVVGKSELSSHASNANAIVDEFNILGNIFDDLKLWGEDCEIYKQKDNEGDEMCIVLNGDGTIHIETDGCGSSSSPENAIAFAKKIIQIAYTAKRKAGK